MKKQILLSYFPKFSVAKYKQLTKHFSTLDDAWHASFSDLREIGWKESYITSWQQWKSTVDEDKIKKILEQEQIICLTKEDEAYPNLLKEIYDPPFCLFVRGTLTKDDFTLAVVGTRSYTSYGKQITDEMVYELAAQGITIVSGLAIGIDGFAHLGALQAGGKTVAVLGGGINKRHIYPAEHRHLAEKIIDSGGALLSEYPPGALPSKFSFPKRNRIIAGMSLGTLVIEAPISSGALITADCSLQMGRDVFAIPQNITSKTAFGPNTLIKQGAILVSSAKDIIDSLNLKDIKQFVETKAILPDSPTEAILMRHLSREPTHIDLLIKQSRLPGPTVTSTITMMEMKGKIRNLGSMMYVLSR